MRKTYSEPVTKRRTINPPCPSVNPNHGEETRIKGFPAAATHNLRRMRIQCFRFIH